MSTTASWADYDASGAYRYELGRVWDAELPVAVWIMLNPSTADAEVDDPTIRRVTAFTRREGLGGFVAVNLSAYRSTDPAGLRASQLPVLDAENERRIARALAETTGPVVAAWGATVELLPARPNLDVLAHLAAGRLWCLGRTKAGHPRHPLYVRGDIPLERFGPERDTGRPRRAA